MQQLNVELRPIIDLKPYANNARTHSKQQIKQIARSIERFGFTNPVLIADDDEIIAGHGRVSAAKQMGWTEVPTIRLSHLSPIERRAYVLADNKLAENAGWDEELLAIELQGLIDLEFEIDDIGFSMTEIDIILDGAQDKGPTASDGHLDSVPPILAGPAVTHLGDLWHLGEHRLLCGDARSSDDVQRLCTDPSGAIEPIAMLFTDPPYNVKIHGHVSGLGRTTHREFVEASGEMSKEQFTEFLTTTLGTAAAQLKDGAIAYVCMDWRHMPELLAAGDWVFDELKNLCVWNKTNGGMGTFYRSKHELIFVFKKGVAAHTNNFGLGENGRYRTNVWDYAGISSLSSTRAEEQAMHPTVKPVAMLADAMRDCSNRGETILNVFGGSGSTLIAAEQCGRKARLIEIDPLYCDTILRRFEDVTGKPPTLSGTEETFTYVRQRRETDTHNSALVEEPTKRSISTQTTTDTDAAAERALS
ncbi:site-specific DNA-methyltransferase [Pseudahrensia aquimaris]|uniref:site-specific DNA-methyltransferase (adenine-specific) n=1 Tax=Pseudahrensia aquimaris TaxID=744461 RepID=A0ABW3FFC3_9HYPH